MPTPSRRRRRPVVHQRASATWRRDAPEARRPARRTRSRRRTTVVAAPGERLRRGGEMHRESRRARRTRLHRRRRSVARGTGVRRGGELHRDLDGLPGRRAGTVDYGLSRAERRVRRGGEMHRELGACPADGLRRQRQSAARRTAYATWRRAAPGARGHARRTASPRRPPCVAPRTACATWRRIVPEASGSCPADGFASPSVVCSPASCSADNLTLNLGEQLRRPEAVCPAPQTTACPGAMCDPLTLVCL